MPIEDRVRQKEAIDRTASSAVRGHPGREPSDPPPVHVTLPDDQDSIPPKRRTVVESIERAAKWIAAVAGGAAVIWGAINWLVHAAIETAVESTVARLDPMVLRPTVEQQKEMIALGLKVPPKLEDKFAEILSAYANLQKQCAATDPNNPQSELGKKMDRLDETLRERLPPKPNKPAVPSVGPSAKQEGRH